MKRCDLILGCVVTIAILCHASGAPLVDEQVENSAKSTKAKEAMLEVKIFRPR